jgi:hypothetical protein
MKTLEVDINPDGVPVKVDWAKFIVGTSVFIPCINTTKAIVQLKRVAKQKHLNVNITIKCDKGRWGVRVWRIM